MENNFYDRVVYRPEYNYSFAYYQDRIIEVIKVYLDSDFSTDPNNVIELYEILQFFLLLDGDDSVSAEDKAYYKSHIQPIRRVIGVYFSQITPDNFSEVADKTHPHFAFRFWELMCHYKRINDITPEAIKAFLISHHHHLDDILAQKEMAQKFSAAIYEFLVENPKQITVIVSALLAKRERPAKTLHIKTAFSAKQINTLFKLYVQREPDDINQMRLISISQNDPEIGLDDEIRLIAKRNAAKLSEDILARGVCSEHSLKVSFGPYDEWKKCENADGEYSLTYDSRWIAENLDYPTLLDNLICWLEYADGQCRSTLPMKKQHISALEDMTIVKGKKTYDAGYSFKMVHFLQLIQMEAYCDQLKKHNIEIENIFAWFFEEYLPNEFSADKFTYNVPSSGSSFFEKCKLIVSEIESVLKQFKQYQKKGYIDRELLEMSSEHLFFPQIPSLLSSKYVYAKSERIKWCITYLFNDCMLGFFPDNDEYEDCDCLYDAMAKYKQLPKFLFEKNYHKHPLYCLLDFGVLVESNGYFTLNLAKARILRDLYNCSVLCYHHNRNIQSIIDELIVSDDLYAESTLFSVPEQEYLDYILNKASFSNGLDLRNKYVHGSKPKNDKENSSDYLEFLLIMAMIIIKINDEFCLKYPLQ